MSSLDWIVLALTLVAIISYGLYKSTSTKNLEGYFLSNRNMPWYLVLLSIMGTQASAITFLSAPGQAFTDGMRFLQYYFGLPIAMIVLAKTFVPLFNKLQLFTAYEFLEKRFDVKTRTFTSIMFLISRGLSTGISVYAPSIILSSLLGWDIFYTNIFMGGLLIIYTVSGGAKAVAYTQQLQLVVIFIALCIAGCMIVHILPKNIGFTDAIHIAHNKMNVITTGFTGQGFDWKDKYNIWSGVIGGFFLAMSYFGTDQSQVGRYLTAKDVKESQKSLLMNGLVKVPMQFAILLLGVLLFTFYQFKDQPIFFNNAAAAQLAKTYHGDSARILQEQYAQINQQKQQLLTAYKAQPIATQAKLEALDTTAHQLRKSYKNLVKKIDADDNDTNYVFLRFVVDYLPKGLVGLLIAIIFLAAWGSIAAALNALASCTMIDIHKRFFEAKQAAMPEEVKAKKEYRASRWYTFIWGVFCVVVAEFATGMGSLIEAVNVLGSLFYGVILGIFLVAFYVKKVQGTAVFVAAIISELFVMVIFILDKYNYIGLGFLWLNVIGALLVVIISWLLQLLDGTETEEEINTVLK